MADVIDRLEEASEPRRETWSGTVTVTATGGAFPDGRQKITVSWLEQDVDCAYLASYTPAIGDHVIFLKNGSSFFVLGPAA